MSQQFVAKCVPAEIIIFIIIIIIIIIIIATMDEAADIFNQPQFTSLLI